MLYRTNRLRRPAGRRIAVQTHHTRIKPDPLARTTLSRESIRLFPLTPIAVGTHHVTACHAPRRVQEIGGFSHGSGGHPHSARLESELK